MEYLNTDFATSQPQAISVSTLDDPAWITRCTTVSVEQPIYKLSSSFNSTNTTQLSQTGILQTNKSSTLCSGPLPSVHFPITKVSGSQMPSYLLTLNQPGWAVLPKPKNATQIQTLTQSLWIGNLDSSITSKQLIHVFVPYGAIESLRLFPEEVRHRHKT